MDADRLPGSQAAAGDAFDAVHRPGDCSLWRVHAVAFPTALDAAHSEAMVFRDEHATPVLGHKDKVNVQSENTVPAGPLRRVGGKTPLRGGTAR